MMISNKSVKVASKPQKRDPKKILETASDSMIKKLLNVNGTIADLSVDEMKKLLEFGKKKKLPENNNYTTEQL